MTEDEIKQKMPMAYFLSKAANDDTKKRQDDRIDYLLATHGSHLEPEHVDAIRSLDQDQVTRFLCSEALQGAMPGITNGLNFMVDEPDVADYPGGDDSSEM